MTTLDAPLTSHLPATGWPGPFLTVPNLVTLARTVAAVVLGIGALIQHDVVLLVGAYGVYWLGDMLDGWTARRLVQETRAGALLDIVADRVCATVLCAGLLVLAPDAAPVVVVFLLSFTVLDTMLSSAFLCWPILGPNDFHVVDRRVWALNWSPLAKAVNTTGTVGAIALQQYDVALLVASAVLVVKVWSAYAVVRLLDRHP
jgi:CDP-diacylglycerol--glycerol-3-phosphate 3-phosphatidyltransferase